MDREPFARLEETAALLERAYRMALVLQGRVCAAGADVVDIPAHSFEQIAVVAELLSILDEARVSLLAVGANDEFRW